MNVYVVEIYDTTEYDNSIIDLQVFFTLDEAKSYVLKEVKDNKSYQDIYVEIRITEWIKGCDLTCSKYCDTGASLLKYGFYSC